LTKVLLIALAGGIGATLRFWVSGLVQSTATSFPVGTLAVNVIGCGVIGFLSAFFAGPQLVPEAWRFAVLVGLLGGFTTFSSFAWETLSLARDAQWLPAAANILLSNTLGLTAAWFGYRLGLKIFGT